MEKQARQPGDLLLDRYFAGADAKTRERARAAFAEFARALEEIGDEILARSPDSRESEACGRIPPTPEITS